MDVLNAYEFQRLVFEKAVGLGWAGREPLMLGGREADEAFQDAYRFLKWTERTQGEWWASPCHQDVAMISSTDGPEVPQTTCDHSPAVSVAD